MLCSKCGANNPDNANVCCMCGESLRFNQPQFQQSTKFCIICGNKISTQAVICPKCGAQQSNIQSVNNSTDSGSLGWWWLGYLLPLVGLIVYLVSNNSKPRTAKLSELGAISSVIIEIIAGFVFGAIFGGISAGMHGQFDVPAVIGACCLLSVIIWIIGTFVAISIAKKKVK